MDELAAAVSRLDSRLDVHDEKHIRLDSEHSQFAEDLRRQKERLDAVERLAGQTSRDLDKLTGAMNKILWAVVTPLLSLLAIGIIYIIAIVGNIQP